MTESSSDFQKQNTEQSPSLDYPTALDVVKWKGRNFQVVGTARTGAPESDFYMVRPLKANSETFRIGNGAKFERMTTKQDLPKRGNIMLRGEHIMITGKIVGGEKLDYSKAG